MPKKVYKDYQAHQTRIQAFRSFVVQNKWTIVSEQELDYDAHQITVSNGISRIPTNFYPSGKMVVGGKPGVLHDEILVWCEKHSTLSPKATDEQHAQLSLAGIQPPPTQTALQELQGIARIGIDESGKGDYFGPLVVGAVYVDKDTEAKLTNLGVRDSKQLYDKRILQLAEMIKMSCPHEIVVIGAKRYNELYEEMHNLNRLLAKGHAFALERLLEKMPCDLAIADQFGNESYIREALLEKGRAIKLVQRPRAEEDIAVAAASVLARAAFVQQIELLSSRLGTTLPKGASDPAIVTIGRQIVAKYGRETLAKVAKLHFKTTEDIL
ncbi:MAG TPA: ribonuclease HIII [Ktedonobacteraceae bacterium]|nr:ribonuclease HIII [Ktedonobacteraceae bacterium]